MEKFIPYEKLSKKKRAELDRMRRGTWNGFNPVTRRPKSSRAYDRNKEKRMHLNDSACVLYL